MTWEIADAIYFGCFRRERVWRRGVGISRNIKNSKKKMGELRILRLHFPLPFIKKNNKKITWESSGSSLPPSLYHLLRQTMRKSPGRAQDPPYPLPLTID